MSLPTVLDLTALRSLYAQRRITLHDLVDALSARMDDADPAVFITRATLAGMRAQADALVARAPAPNSLPLWGMPFAVKATIDVVGFPSRPETRLVRKGWVNEGITRWTCQP